MQLKANNIELYYEKTGQGKPLLLLHGNGQDHRVFDKIVQKLKNDFTVYTIDSRNHGQSSKTNVYSYQTMAEDLYSFIQELKLGRVNLVGFSDGAITSLLFALEHQEKIGKMALLGVNLKPTDFREKIYQSIKNHYEETKDPLYRLMLEQPNIELADLKKITVPTLIVAAEKELYRAELYPELAETMPNARFLLMPGHKHESYIENQDILYPQLKEFFA